MPDYPIAATTASSGGMYQYGMIADLRTSNALLSNASPTAGSSAAQTAPSTNDTVALSAEGRQLAAAIPSPVLTETDAAPSPIDATSAQQLGKAVLVGTATTQSGRKVTIEQYNPATAADNGVSPEPRTGYMVTIAATDQQEQQRYMLNGNTIINEDENGALHVSAYSQATDGNDIIIGLLDTSLSGGAGDDTLFDFRQGGMGNIDGGAGDDTIVVSGVHSVGYIHSGDGNDTINFTGNVVGADISTGDGNDTVNIAGSVYGGNISLGAGNDSLQANDLSTFFTGQLNVDTGDGNDQIKAGSIGEGKGQVNIDTGNGNDLIHAGDIGIGGQVNINTGDGNDSIHASWIGIGGNSQVNIDTGDGNDRVHSNWIGIGTDGHETQVNINAGSGNDSLSFDWLGVAGVASGQVNINTGSGNDSLTFNWLGGEDVGNSQVNINMGSGNDYINAGIEGLRLVTQAKMEAMRDLVRETPADKATPKSSHNGDALLANTSGMATMTGESTPMARRGSITYRTQSQSDNATTETAAQMHSGLRIRNS
jgi:hypothetical protein